jgi:hypothetical protein
MVYDTLQTICGHGLRQMFMDGAIGSLVNTSSFSSHSPTYSGFIGFIGWTFKARTWLWPAWYLLLFATNCRTFALSHMQNGLCGMSTLFSRLSRARSILDVLVDSFNIVWRISYEFWALLLSTAACVGMLPLIVCDFHGGGPYMRVWQNILAC